jgi:hypothetical protein
MIGLIMVFNEMIRYDCYVSKAQCSLRSEHFSLHFITFPFSLLFEKFFQRAERIINNLRPGAHVPCAVSALPHWVFDNRTVQTKFGVSLRAPSIWGCLWAAAPNRWLY